MFKWLFKIIKQECQNCSSKGWKRGLWKEGDKRPLYCDQCPGKDGEDFRGLDATMNEMDKKK